MFVDRVRCGVLHDVAFHMKEAAGKKAVVTERTVIPWCNTHRQAELGHQGPPCNRAHIT